MPHLDSDFVGQTLRRATTAGYHTHFDDSYGCLEGHSRMEEDPIDAELGARSDGTISCDYCNDNNNDNHNSLEQDSHFRIDADYGYMDHDSHEPWNTNDGHAELTSHGVVRNGQRFGCEDALPLIHKEVTHHASETNKSPVGQRKRLRDLAAKAKEHLRNEQKRKEAVDMLRRGVREASTFIAEVQALDKASAGSGRPRAGAKDNGKKLAKVCVKVATQRLAK